MGLLFALVGAGASAIIARCIGAGDLTQARKACSQAMALAVVAGLMATGAVLFWAPLVTDLIRLGPATAATAVRFIKIDSSAYWIEAVTFIGAACLRGAGNTRTPMVVLGVVNMVNIAASWLLAFGLGLGVNGIAWGTVTARYVGGIMMIVVLLRGFGGLRCVPSLMPPEREWFKRIARIGGPAALDGTLMWCGQLVFMMIITRSGQPAEADTLYAAHMIGIRIESLSYLSAMAWSIAAATLIGQNLGARTPDRARRCANEAVRQSVLLLSAMGVLYLVFAPQFFRFLSEDAGVIAAGVPALRALALVQPALAVLIVYIGSLRGAGDTAFPMIFTVIGMLLIRVPVAYFCGVVLKGGLIGAWMGMCADLAIRAVLMTLRFRTGRWATVRV